ncbi:protein TBATA isoform 6 [Mus musculus]|nr:protein TBATA isoform 6 [Mus musculus]|eukprot:NP_001017409.1 protein TBATA isoform 6 [Mus musculus]
MFLGNVYKGSLAPRRDEVTSPKAEPQPETKPENLPRSHGDVGLQKETVVPGIVDFELIHEELKTTKPQTSQPTPSAYRFGRLSHHSFFSRHHPQPQRVTHIQDIAGKPVCVVRDEFSLSALTQPTFLSRCLMGMPTISVPIGDPQSNRNPQLSTSVLKTQGGQTTPTAPHPHLSCPLRHLEEETEGPGFPSDCLH